MSDHPVRVLFVFRRQRRERLQRYVEGHGPDEMLYGLNHLDPRRFQVDYIEGDDAWWSWTHHLCYPVEWLIARRLGMGFALHIALENLTKLRQAHVIISTVDTCGLPIAMLKGWGRLETPLVYISQGLSDRLSQFPPSSLNTRLFLYLYRRFLLAAERILVLGEGAVEPLTQALHQEPGQVFCLPFGIDDRFWTPGKDASEDYILSVGSDPARDYDTLLKAVTREPLIIVTRLPISAESRRPQVRVASAFTDIELRELYRRARLVAIPLRDVAQPAGQSATLQAMACGKAVILTRTQGLWEPQQMRHLENCYLVEPGDVSGLQQAIRYLIERPEEAERIGENARHTIEKRYRSDQFAASLVNHIQALLSARVDNSANGYPEG